MRIAVFLIALAIIVIAAIAEAQTLHGVTDALSAGGAPAPPTCSNSLDFSMACNSQYIPVVLR